jgi:hypothetical protein
MSALSHRLETLLASAWLVYLLPVSAQVSASLSGRALDQTGTAFSGASVRAENLDTAVTRTAVTDQAGRYQLLSLPIGRYGDLRDEGRLCRGDPHWHPAGGRSGRHRGPQPASGQGDRAGESRFVVSQKLFWPRPCGGHRSAFENLIPESEALFSVQAISHACVITATLQSNFMGISYVHF